MRLATLTSVALLLSAGCAFAQTNMTPNTMTSGRPSAVLNDDQCQAVWKMASPNGGDYFERSGRTLHRQFYNG